MSNLFFELQNFFQLFWKIFFQRFIFASALSCFSFLPFVVLLTTLVSKGECKCLTYFLNYKTFLDFFWSLFFKAVLSLFAFLLFPASLSFFLPLFSFEAVANVRLLFAPPNFFSFFFCFFLFFFGEGLFFVLQWVTLQVDSFFYRFLFFFVFFVLKF